MRNIFKGPPPWRKVTAVLQGMVAVELVRVAYYAAIGEVDAVFAVMVVATFGAMLAASIAVRDKDGE